MKKILSILASVCLVLFLCSCGEAPNTNTDTGQVSESSQKNTLTISKESVDYVKNAVDAERTEPPAKSTYSSNPDYHTMSKNGIISFLEMSQRSAFGDNCKVYENDSVIIVEVWNDGLAEEVMLLKNLGVSTNDDWDEIKEIACSQSLEIQETVDDLAGDGYLIMYCIGNDINPDNILLGAMDGVIVMDILSE